MGTGSGASGARGGGSAASTSSQSSPMVNTQTSAVPWDQTHTARQDFYGATNNRTLQGSNFSTDMQTVQAAPVGSTAQIKYSSTDVEYARKVDTNRWSTDSGRTLTNNDVASAASPVNGAKVQLNTMVKKKQGFRW